MFSLRAIVDDADLPQFEFEGVDGEVYQLPHIRQLTTRQALAAMEGDLEAVLREVAPDTADVVLNLPAYALDALIKAWLEHSEIEAGKSASPSSTTTAMQSKRTSRSTGSRSRR